MQRSCSPARALQCRLRSRLHCAHATSSPQRRSGISERVAMRMTGHKTPSVFQRYNIVSDGDLCDAARRLDVASLKRSSR